MPNIKKYKTMLFSFMVLNLMIVVGLDSFMAIIIDKITNEKLIKLFPLPSVIILTTILNGAFSSRFKERLVFLRWSTPLPASRLRKTLNDDHRFSIDQVKEKYGPIPDDPKEQNMYWYNKIYKPNQGLNKIIDVHKNFLMTRDMTAICFIILVFSTINAIFLTGNWLHVIIMFLEYLLLTLVASNYGKRFVATVVAESI